MRAKSKSWKMLILGILVVLTVYLDWCLLTIAYKNEIIYGFAFVVAVISWILYIKIYSLIVSYQDLWEQLRIANLSIGLLNVVILLFDIIRDTNDTNIWIYLIHIGWIIVTGVCFWKIDRREEKIVNQNIKRWKQSAKIDRFGLLILLAVIVILSLDNNMVQFKWDGLLYYKTCQNLSLYSISNLAIYGHIAQTYGALIRIASLITGNVALAMIVMNILLLLSGTVAIYKVFRLVISEQDNIICLLGAAMFAFSPFCLGMVNYHNLDFYLQCIFPIVVYFVLSRKWIFSFLAALLFCFTKEPAIVIYGGLCIGVVGVDYCKMKGMYWTKRIEEILKTRHYYLMALPGVLWIATFSLLGPWSAGVGGVALDFEYIVEKIKVLYTLNFNWLLTLIILLAWFKFSFVKKKSGEWLGVVVPLVVSQILFTTFSCCFKTVNHPRYADSNVVMLSILAILAVCYLFQKYVAQIVVGVLAFLMLISSFWTIDPISKMNFKVVNIGNTEMVSTQQPFLGDGMIYNKQMLWLENVMNQAFADVLEETTYIAMPALEDSTYFFDGMATVSNVANEYQIDTYYWIEEKRNFYPTNKALKFNCIQVSNNMDLCVLKEEMEQDYIDYFYFENINREHNQNIMSQYEVLEEESYQYMGWKLKRIRIQL